jgi:hypothetical protein
MRQPATRAHRPSTLPYRLREPHMSEQPGHLTDSTPAPASNAARGPGGTAVNRLVAMLESRLQKAGSTERSAGGPAVPLRLFR